MALTDNLISYWKMENDVTDEQGNHDGTNNGATFVAGNTGFGQAADFDGVNDYINIGNAASAASTALQPSVGTLAGWIKSNGNDGAIVFGAGTPMTSCANRDHGPSIIVGYQPSGGQSKIYANVGDGTNAALRITALKTWTDGWHHVAMTWNSTWSSNADMKIYVDGVDSGFTTANWGTGWNTTAQKTSRAWWIGSSPVSCAAVFHGFDGAIDDVAVWGRILSAAEILEIYNLGGTGLVPIGSGFRLTVVT